MYVFGNSSEPHLSSHVVEGQGVGERLAGGLDGEVVLVVANGESGNFERNKHLTYMYNTQLTSVHRLCRDSPPTCWDLHGPVGGCSPPELPRGGFDTWEFQDSASSRLPDTRSQRKLGQWHWANIGSNWFYYSTLAIRYHIWNATRCDRRGSL